MRFFSHKQKPRELKIESEEDLSVEDILAEYQAEEHALIARVPNISAAIKELKEQGLWVYGTAADGQSDLWHTDFTGAMALVIGSEGDGMGRLVKENCDFVVRLPMKGKVSSLNASAAAAVTMYEVLRQRSGC